MSYKDEFGTWYSPVSEGYVVSLKQRAQSGGLGLQTAFEDANDADERAPKGLGLCTSLPSSTERHFTAC
ncbi:MAG: hypothetical protein WC043_03980 [Pseudobdellovibrionaceae bacterium]